MTDDDWLEQQQRAHNLRSFRYELPSLRPITRRRQPFTLEQLLVAERWLENQKKAAIT